MTAAEALNKLVDHLLGENWYSIYMNTEDVYTDIVDTICSRYSGKKEDRVTQWRRRHKRCQFCRHIEYLDNPCGISAYKCRVATGCETPSRERKFQEYVETKNMLDLFGGEHAITSREERGRMLYEKIKESGLSYSAVAERINLSKSTIWGYIQNGVSERNAALVIAAVDEMVREAKEE